MPPNRSPLADEDCKQVLDRALASAKGLIIKFSGGSPEMNSAEATRTRARLHNVRKRDRLLSNDLYPEDDPRRGVSAWDPIIIRKIDLDDGSVQLHLIKSDMSLYEIEEIV